jgi:hypothetical protein
MVKIIGLILICLFEFCVLRWIFGGDALMIECPGYFTSGDSIYIKNLNLENCVISPLTKGF